MEWYVTLEQIEEAAEVFRRQLTELPLDEIFLHALHSDN